LGLLPSISETTDGSTGEANVVSIDAPLMENLSCTFVPSIMRQGRGLIDEIANLLETAILEGDETSNGPEGEAIVVSVDAPSMENFSFTTLSEGSQEAEWPDNKHDHKRGTLESDHGTILTPMRPARGAGRTAEAAMVSEAKGYGNRNRGARALEGSKERHPWNELGENANSDPDLSTDAQTGAGAGTQTNVKEQYEGWILMAQTGAGAGAQTDAGAGAQTDAGAGAQTDAGAGAQTDAGADAQTGAGAGAQTDAGADAQTGAGAGAQTDAGAGAQTGAGAGPQTGAGAGTQTNVKEQYEGWILMQNKGLTGDEAKPEAVLVSAAAGGESRVIDLASGGREGGMRREEWAQTVLAGEVGKIVHTLEAKLSVVPMGVKGDIPGWTPGCKVRDTHQGAGPMVVREGIREWESYDSK
jgi:hypothetical protein